MKKPVYTIYLLVDPRDHKPFYIGQTKWLELRLEQHCDPSDDDKSDRAKTIREIVADNHQPMLVALETTTRKTSALMREMFWIVLFKSHGIRLKNRESQQWLLKQYDELEQERRKTQSRKKSTTRKRTRRKSRK